MKWRTELQPSDGATVVSQETSYKAKFGPLGVLLDAVMMKRTLNKNMRGMFDELKRYVEGERMN